MRAAPLCLALSACAAAPPAPTTVSLAEPLPAPSAQPEPAPPPKPRPPPSPVTAPITHLAMCCAAIAQTGNSVPDADRPRYVEVAEACRRLRAEPDSEEALARLRSLLARVRVPAACR